MSFQVVIKEYSAQYSSGVNLNSVVSEKILLIMCVLQYVHPN